MQTLRKADAQAFEDRGSEIPIARNNMKVERFVAHEYVNTENFQLSTKLFKL